MVGFIFCLRKLARMSCASETGPAAIPTVSAVAARRGPERAQKPVDPHRDSRSVLTSQGLVELLQFRRHHAVAQIHGRRRVLHRTVVDHHQLLHIVRNRRAGIRGQLRRRKPGWPPPAAIDAIENLINAFNNSFLRKLMHHCAAINKIAAMDRAISAPQSAPKNAALHHSLYLFTFYRAGLHPPTSVIPLPARPAELQTALQNLGLRIESNN